MIVVSNIAALYTCCSDFDVGLVENGMVAIDGDKIVYAGASENGPKWTQEDTWIDGTGLVVVPGLVDCHTHTVYAGTRADEFQRRLAGESYVKILEEGGGINKTVRFTRDATREQLAEFARARVQEMRDQAGVTTVEIKSGYGLTPQDEEKMLLAARDCQGIVRVETTFLGAHTFPPEYRGEGKRAEYVKQVIEEQLPRCAPLASYVDIFCDRGAFNLAEAREILSAGKTLGLKVRAHAEQIESTGCAKLVAELGGLSADHLEQLDEEGAKAMGEAGVVAVLLPGAQLYLKDISPPVPMLRKHNVKMAIGTDFNPGSSPVHDLWTVATLGCILQGLTVSEALLGMTRIAGLALGRKELGWIGEGSVADLVILSPPPGEPARVESLFQHMGTRKVHTVIMDGKIQFQQST